jgi:hypothetical protein
MAEIRRSHQLSRRCENSGACGAYGSLGFDKKRLSLAAGFCMCNERERGPTWRSQGQRGRAAGVAGHMGQGALARAQEPGYPVPRGAGGPMTVVPQESRAPARFRITDRPSTDVGKLRTDDAKPRPLDIGSSGVVRRGTRVEVVGLQSRRLGIH